MASSKAYLDFILGQDTAIMMRIRHCNAREVIGKFTVPDDGKEYMLLFTISKDKENPTAFANTALSVMLGANLKSRERTCQNSQKLGCNVTVSEDGQNHFWLLKRK